MVLHEVFNAKAIARWPFFFIALASGIVTSIATAVTGAVTFVMSGHLLKIGSSVADLLTNGLTPAGTAAARKSLVALSCFIIGAGAFGFSPVLPTPFFPTLGAAYAVLLSLYARVYEKAKPA